MQDASECGCRPMGSHSTPIRPVGRVGIRYRQRRMSRRVGPLACRFLPRRPVLARGGGIGLSRIDQTRRPVPGEGDGTPGAG